MVKESDLCYQAADAIDLHLH